MARRWRSLACATVVAGFLVLVPAAPASAHTVSGVGATNFHTTLSAVSPAVAGVDLSVIENGSRLQLRNTTATDVIIAGYAGEPYARVGPSGVYVNDNSPATYLNADRYSTTAVPANADGKSAPVWRKVADSPLWRWHDHRVHWMLRSLPPAVAADPGAEHHISSWTVVLDYGGRRLSATGSLDWIPGPSAWPWFALAVLVGVGVAAAALPRRPHRLLAVATGCLVALDMVHGLGVAFVVAGTVPQRLGAFFGTDALLAWPFAILGAWLLWSRHTRAAWLTAVVGLITAVNLFIDDAPAVWRSSAPTALPFVANRAVVAVVVGAGLGLVAALPVLLRRHPPTVRPWTLPPHLANPGPSLLADSGPPAPEPTADPIGEPAAVASGSAGRAGAGSVANADDAHGTGGLAHGTAPSPPADAVGRQGAVGGQVAVGGPDAVGGVGRRQMAGYLAVGALGAIAGAAAGATAAKPGPQPSAPAPTATPLGDVGARTVSFFGTRQAGIATPGRPQAHAWVAGFDLAASTDRAALRGLLRRWSDAAAKLTRGESLGAPDDLVTAGLGAAALTVTVGFGPSLFGKAGIPAAARPEALAPLPGFAGESLDPARGDGDLGIVVAADDPVVVAHAARVLRRLGNGVLTPRWQLSGFNSARGAGPDGVTPRNLMGQVDGSNNPKPADPDFATRIFVPDQGQPVWLRGGSYLVVRRIRMLLDDWDTLTVTDQERVIGRRKDSGAPLSGGAEHTAANFGKLGADGQPLIAATAHMRRATPAFNEGAAMLRRGFSYVDASESGLLFLAWQADPRHGFIPVQQHLVQADALGRFIRHESSALFAMPGGLAQDAPGDYIGRTLVEG